MEHPFISVILPLAIGWEPVYRAGEEFRVGDRVLAPLSGRTYSAVVSALLTEPGMDESKLRTVKRTEGHFDRISPEEIAFWRELANYYLCTVGEVFKAAYPSVRIKGEEVSSRQTDRLAAKLHKARERLAVARKDSTRERYAAEISATEAALSKLGALPCRIPRIGADEGTEKILQALSPGKPVLLSGNSPERIPPMMLPLISRTLSEGKSVLYLVPEIRAGEDTGESLREAFPDAIRYHSRISDVERREAAGLVRSGGPRLVIGTRSTLFLPFSRLGLVIVTEEQSPSYKQDSPAPRYNARDAAIMLSRIHGAEVILTSLTPSLESVQNVRSGRYSSVAGQSAPLRCRTVVIDTAAERRKHGMNGNFSLKLLDLISRTEGKVLIMEKYLEEELRALLPDAEGKLRFGLDEGMFGNDFSGISLVASVQTDRYLSRQDFRADERAWQLLREFSQFCVRDGRKGVFVIQTRQPGHPVIQLLAKGEDASEALLAERKAFSYPPFTRMVDVIVRDVNLKRLELLSKDLAGLIGSSLDGVIVTGSFSRTEEGTERVIRLLFPRDRQLRQRKETLLSIVGGYEKDRRYTGHVFLDADPR